MFDGAPSGLRARNASRLLLDRRDPINRGLVAFWPLAEPHQSLAEDIGPRRYHLTGTTWPTRIVGPRGRATNFAGGSSQRLQNAGLVWPGGQHAAISCWINVAGSTNGSPYDFGGGRALTSGNAFYGHLPYGDNNAYFYYGAVGSGEISTSLAAHLNQWVHIAWAASPTRKAIWINGRVANESGTVSAAVAAGTNAYLGYSGASSMYHYGAMRMFRLRAWAWTDAEVQRLYRDDLAGTLAPEERIFVALGRAGPTVHALIADDLGTGAPGLGTPALGQIHALTADDLGAGTPGLGAPALGQIHALIADSLGTGAPELGAPALGQVHALIADDLGAGVPGLGSPALNPADITAPASRTITWAAQDRNVTWPAESRVVTWPATDRTVTWRGD